MATEVWGVLAEAQRPTWPFTPFERVGPLEFGMTHGQAEAALHGLFGVAGWQSAMEREDWVDFADVGSPGPAVTAYYDKSIGLAAVAVNALRGPQVIHEGIRLVGQTPSRLEDLFTGYLMTQGMELRYSQCADPCSPQLGLVLRAQRAGDVVLSRPVLVAAAWADRCWDTSESWIPRREWKIFEW